MNAVGIVLPIEPDRDAGPFRRRISAGLIGQHVAMPISIDADNVSVTKPFR